MNKFQRAGHILEKLKNETEQSINFVDEIKQQQRQATTYVDSPSAAD